MGMHYAGVYVPSRLVRVLVSMGLNKLGEKNNSRYKEKKSR